MDAPNLFCPRCMPKRFILANQLFKCRVLEASLFYLPIPRGHAFMTTKLKRMTFHQQNDRIKRFDGFIRRKGTGTPEDFAKKMNISRATLFRLLDYFRSLGAKIVYNKERRTYYYEEPFELKF